MALLASNEAASLGTGASTVVCTDAKGGAMRQVHILTGPERRIGKSRDVIPILPSASPHQETRISADGDG